MASAFEPYLSVVVTSRNDNHGGDLNQRTEIFINGLLQQAERFQLPLELIVVEWNPPPERPPLREALRWPPPSKWFEYRIITVPKGVHGRLAHSAQLALYQMIAKNVGIRRARAPFILASNVDLLFSDELFAFLAARQLKTNCLYRCDRVDVDRSVPEHLPVHKQLEYCRTHTLRVARKEGVYLQRPGSKSRTIDQAVAVDQLTPQEHSELKLGSRPQSASTRKSFWLRAGFRLVRILLDVFQRIQFVWSELGRAPLWSAVELLVNHRGLPNIHINACGDFTLLDRDSWFRLRGYSEWQGFSMHLDSLILVDAYRQGIEFFNLSPNQVIYHLEHGGGWTPDGEEALYRRMQTLQIPILTFHEFRYKAERMLGFSEYERGLENWGFAEEQFSEWSPALSAIDARARHQNFT